MAPGDDTGIAPAPPPQQAAPPKEVIILKLGGSSITDKAGYETLKPEGLAAAASLIQRCHEAGLGVIVVHGAGSFGHPQAKKYLINKGWQAVALEGATEKERRAAFEARRFGFAATRCSVLKLSNLILSDLVERGLPATTLSALGSWRTDNGQVVQNSTSSVVAALLGLGFIPVLHGDGVLDGVKGCNVLSGDTIIRELARDVPNVKRVVFLTDVDGVFDKSPELPGASLICQILVNDAGGIASLVTTESSGAKDDVTGGMELKLSTAIAIQVDHGGKVPVFISKIGSAASADACLKGDVGARATKLCKA